YKSGDLARWLPNGSIEFLGRIDHQVKLRGYRIELGEIESQILRHEKITNCAVIPHEYPGGEKKLVSYIVPDGGNSVPGLAESVRTHLKQSLPEYMVPAIIIPIEKLPLS